MICIVTRGLVLIDTIGTSIRPKLLEDIEKCNYFTLLKNGSTDSSVVLLEKGVLQIRSKFMRGTPIQKCNFNKVSRVCRTPLKKISGGLLFIIL